MNQVICPYCKKPAKWVNNEEIYGKRYGKSYKAYYCKPCDARVGCHTNSHVPMGTLADKKTREWRIRTHAVVDPLWKKHKMKRKEVYKLLADKFGHEVHIAEADILKCQKIIEYIKVRNIL